jgi:hypothetical protein
VSEQLTNVSGVICASAGRCSVGLQGEEPQQQAGPISMHAVVERMKAAG